MERRSILVGVAATLAGPALVGSAFAQSRSAVPMGGGSAPAAGAPLGVPEVEHGKKTALSGATTLQSSEIAVQKARNSKVKEFATFEIAEQKTIAEVLSGMDPSLGRARPDSKMADAVQQLNAMPAGAEFDKAYLANQIEGHRTLLTIQEDYLKVGENREHVAIAKLARGMIKEHLAILADLQTMS